MRKVPFIALTIFISAVINLFFYNHFYSDLKNKMKESYLFIIAIFVLIIIVFSFNILKYLLLKVNTMTRKNMIILISSSLFFSILLHVTIPMKSSTLGKQTSIEVTVLSEKNDLASGTEVWFNSLYKDGSKVDWENITFSENWVLKDNVVQYAVQSGETIKWDGKVNGNVSLEFVNHAWSGKVRISVDGNSEIVDLYNAEGVTKTFNYNVDVSYILKAYSFFIDISVFSLLFFLLFIVLEYFKVSSDTRNISIKRILFYSLPIAVVYSIYFFTFFPANMSEDSIIQWEQTHGGGFNNWQPAYHTLVLWILYSIWSSPAIVSIVQILFMSLTFGSILYSLEKFGLDKRIIFALLFFYTLNPVNGMMSVTLWKDIPFAIMSLILVFMLFKIYQTKYMWFNTKINIIAFIFVIVNIGLLRHNGIVTVIGVTILLSFLYIKQFKKNILIFSIIFISILIIKGPLYQLLNVVPAPPHFTFAFQLHQIGTILHENVQLNPDDKKYFEKILPINNWKGEDNVFTYSKYSANYLLFHPNLKAQVIIDDKILFLKKWLKLVMSNPSIAINDWKAMTSLVWRISQPSDGYLYTVPKGIISNKYGLTQYNSTSLFKNNILKIVEFTEKKDTNWLFWRPAIFVFIVILFGFIFINRNKDLKAIIVISPVLFEAAGLLISTPAQDARYFYSVSLIAPIIFGLSFIKVRQRNSDEKIR
ncbi:DUF6020 family protein [Paenibacillus sp. 2TAB26]|uniref:DUF6020 family protein n=1 Tax=Paenibacillus sp. 2TAB26 TaxID=3233005 RepID=UPI003F9B9FFE